MGQRRESQDEAVEDVARDRLCTTKAEPLQGRENRWFLQESGMSAPRDFVINFGLGGGGEDGVDKLGQGIDKDSADATCEVHCLKFHAVPAAFTFLDIILGDSIKSRAENSSTARERGGPTEEQLLDDGQVKRAIHIFRSTEGSEVRSFLKVTIEVTSEWSRITVTRITIIGSGLTHLQNDFQPFRGHKPGRNALFNRPAHSDGPEVIKIEVPDKAPRPMIVDRRNCCKRGGWEKPSVSINHSRRYELMAPYHRFRALPET